MSFNIQNKEGKRVEELEISLGKYYDRLDISEIPGSSVLSEGEITLSSIVAVALYSNPEILGSTHCPSAKAVRHPIASKKGRGT
jgi:hypothetical protein